MNSRSLVLLLAASLAACSPKQSTETAAPPPGAPSKAASPASAGDTFGFMSQTPGDVEMYMAAFNSRDVWRRFVHSKAYAALRESHLFRHHFESLARPPGARKALNFLSPNAEAAVTDPNLLKWRHIAADALGTEVFMSCAPGGTQAFAALQQFQTEIRIQQMKGAGGPPNQWMQTAVPSLAPFIETLQIPPIVLGFKMSAQKQALQEQIEYVKAKLPPTVAVATFNIGDKPFTSWTFVAGSLIPADKQQKIHDFLDKNIPDKVVADRYFQSLLARKAEVAFGYVGDYFLVSLGADHAHLKLAATPADSLLQRPELSVLGPYAGKNIWMTSWAAQKSLETLVAQRGSALLPVFEGIKAGAHLSPQDNEQIETDLRRIDTKARNLFRPAVIQAAVSVSFWHDGLRAEQYGGILPAGLATGKDLTLGSTDLPANFIWGDGQEDPAFVAAFLDWVEDITNTGFSFYHRALLPKLNAVQQQQSAMAEAMALPRLIDLYHITRDQLLKSFGTETAGGIDLNGAVPPLPNIPPAIQQQGKIPRLAKVREVKDPKLLAQSWQSYLALARGIAAMLPPTMQAPGGIPDPQHKDLGGADMFWYPLPINAGDLLPNVAVTAGAKNWIFSTSPDYAAAMNAALVKGAPKDANTALKLDIHMTAFYDFAETWIKLLAGHPELIKKPDAAANFNRYEGHILTLLKAFRVLQGMEVRYFEENGGLRVSTVVHVRDIQ